MILAGSYALVTALVLVYVVAKEREAMGCSGFSVGQHCSDYDSHAVRDTNPSKGDTLDSTLKKIVEVGKTYEKTAAWRRCFILSLVVILAIILYMGKHFTKQSHWLELIPIQLVIFSLAYMNQSFQDFHVYSRVKENVGKLVDKVKEEFERQVSLAKTDLGKTDLGKTDLGKTDLGKTEIRKVKIKSPQIQNESK